MCIAVVRLLGFPVPSTSTSALEHTISKRPPCASTSNARFPMAFANGVRRGRGGGWGLGDR